MNRKTLIIVVPVLLLIMARQWQLRPIEHEPGVLVPEAPRQKAVGESVFRLDDYVLTRRARFSLRARVLSRERYFLGREADLSPLDLALGWGAMSDQARLDRIEVTQGGRWYFTRYEFPPPLPDADIIRNSSNMHMIPADGWVSKQLRRVRPGEVIRLEGYLVDVRHPSGWSWNTSLSREDTGDGACELFYVESVGRDG